MKVSIVVCTTNRIESLKRLFCELNKLSYDDFEVIIVNGPSTDGTTQLLDRLKGIKVVQNSELNLSISRNLGIKASAGDIVAFLDDDAVPCEDWLSDIVSCYKSNSRVGGVGGNVYDARPGHGNLQFRNGIVSELGEITDIRDSPGNFNNPNGVWFNRLMGTNATYLRRALAEVGGFDEFYEYIHDETDLCVRLVKLGYKIHHHPEAVVFHYPAKSHNRKSFFNINWYAEVKNNIYFSLKNARKRARPLGYIRTVKRCARLLRSFTSWYRTSQINRTDLWRYCRMWTKGWLVGTFMGLFGPRRFTNSNPITYCEFLRYNKDIVPEYGVEETMLKVALLSMDYPPHGSGGIASYTHDLATGLAKFGHEVHVITRGNRNETLSEGNVRVHRILPSPSPLSSVEPYPETKGKVDYSYSIANELDSLISSFNFDIIESPIWNSEGYVYSLNKSIPLVTRLQTPLRKVMETHGMKPSLDLETACELEKRLIENSDGVIGISDDIVRTIQNMYELNFENKLLDVIPIGIQPLKSIKEMQDNDFTRILYVGRLEKRKGTKVLLDAACQLLSQGYNFKLDVVGQDNSIHDGFYKTTGLNYKEYYQSISSGLPNAEQVRFHGYSDSDKLAQLYTNCDIFTAPSLYESFGIIYLEAMMHGKPVVACAVGGVPETVNSDCGILVEPNDAPALAKALSILIDNPHIRDELGRNGYKRSVEQYSINKMLKKTEDFYRRVIFAKRNNE